MVLGSDARQEFEACIGVFNDVNFGCTQTLASLNNPVTCKNKTHQRMKHGMEFLGTAHKAVPHSP